MSSQHYKVFVINLKKDKDRRDYITKELVDRNIDFEIVEAVYGKELTQEQLHELVDVEQAKKNIGREMSLNEIGCALSHQKIYKKIVDENLDGAFILEDDIILKADFKIILDLIEKNKASLPQCVWLSLDESSIYSRKKMLKLNNEHAVYRGRIVGGTQAYYLDNSAAKKLLEKNTKVKYLADSNRGYNFETNILSIDRCIVKESDGFESNIRNDRVTLHKKNILKRSVARLRNFIRVIRNFVAGVKQVDFDN